MRISDWSSDVCSSDLVDGVGEVPWGHAPVVAQEGLELGGAELGAGSVGGAQQLHQADQPARPVAHPGGQAAPSVGVDLQRSEERRVGKGGASTGKSRWWLDN